MATCPRCAASISPSSPGRSSPWSARMARARRPCCARSPAAASPDGGDPARGHAPRPAAVPCGRGARRGASPGRPQDLPEPHRAREPRARLLHPGGAPAPAREPRARARPLPDPGRAAAPGRRDHVRRTAADAGHRPGADGAAPAADARRAVARARAQDRAGDLRHRGRDQPRGHDRAPGRAEHAPGPGAGRPRLRARERPGGALGRRPRSPRQRARAACLPGDVIMDDLLFSPITELAAAVRSRRLSPVELTRAYLDRIAKLDPTLRAFITVDGDGALAAARALEREATAGAWRGPLHGVPLAHKDLCLIAGLPTSCGTRTADYFVGAPPCTAVARLVAAGAITLGKLSMTELAMGPFGDNAHHGDVQNPWRLGHVSGGSSSGSGAAVAAALAAGALGTDTGGSIRLPAACCGIVGLKATYGRVSRTGVMPLSWSLDHVGPMTRTVADAALMLSVIAGHDPGDATSSRRPVDADHGLERPIAGLRV